MEHYINDQDVRLFIDALRELEKSSATIQKYLRDVNHFRNWVGREIPIDKNRVIEYKRHLKKVYKLTSANSMLSALNTFFKLLNWNEYRVMTFKTQRATFRSEEKELSVREYHQLLQAAKEKGDIQLYHIMDTIAGTGIRVSELPFITVESLATRRALVSLKGKSREVLIPKKLCKKLRAYCRGRKIRNGSIFVTRTGKPVDRSDILHRMKALSKKAGVSREKNLSP